MSAPPLDIPTTAPTPAPTATETQGPLRGVLIELAGEQSLIDAAAKVRDAGYTKFDAHSPYPVHGIDEAVGIKPTILPWIIFGGGFTGCMLGLALQWWTNASHGWEWNFLPTFLQGYSFRISGKPFFSLPANIPIIFELTVLLSAFTAVFGMLIMNNLPWFYSAFMTSARFKRATDDGFFISIDAADPKFNESETLALAESLGSPVEKVYDVATPGLPRWLSTVAWIVVSLALIPPALVAKARFAKSEDPRWHLFIDMDHQEKYKPQQPNPAFTDGRAMRPLVAGTLAREDWPVDLHLTQGGRVVEDATAEGGLRVEWFDGFPEQIEINQELLDRGQQQYNIYCKMCHGYDGAGQGIVHKRVMELNTATPNPGNTWVVPSNLTDPKYMDLPGTEYPHGRIAWTIANGARTMAGYADQIEPKDRWAIVAYVRALQKAWHAGQTPTTGATSTE